MSLERYLDDFGRELATASRRAGMRAPGPLRSRLRPAGGAIAIAAVLIALILVLPAGDGALDPVDEARAALASSNEVIHFVLRSEVAIENQRDGEEIRTPAPTTAEYWTATEPTRWRVALTRPSADRSGGVVVRDYLGRPVTGRIQVAFADRVQRTYTESRDELRVITGVDNAQASAVPTPPPLGADPVAALRELLDAGRLRDTGIVVADGRRVRRFTGVVQRRLGRRQVRIGMRYDVDPESSEPIAVRIESPYSARRDSSRPVSVVRFMRYERIPLTDGSARLLEIHPAAPPKRVVRMTAAQFRDAIERARSK